MKLPLMILGVGLNAFAFLPNNNPATFRAAQDPALETDLSKLPLSGSLSPEKTPWSSSFWPNVYGGIAFRWNDKALQSKEPSFAELHYKVDEINEEISELKKTMYTQDGLGESLGRIAELNNEKRATNLKKAAYYNRYFFQLQRPRGLRDLRRMGQQALDELSPAEKFDAYMIATGQERKFRLTQRVLKDTSPYHAYWEGICNGWSSAALEFQEPEPTTVRASGVTINFGSSDLKALLSYYHAKLRKQSITYIGKRCNVEFPKESWSIENGKEYYKTVVGGMIVKNEVPVECQDTDAGAFHIVMGNYLGLWDEGVLAEVVHDKEIWNQPVYGFNSQVLKRGASLDRRRTPGTAQQVEVKTEMLYANDGGRMFWRHDGSDDEFYAWWEMTNNSSNYRGDSKTYHYILDLNSRGEIIGGHWKSYLRPDFLWVKRIKGWSTNAWANNKQIVKYLTNLRKLSGVKFQK